jgi:hypothetical protein
VVGYEVDSLIAAARDYGRSSRIRIELLHATEPGLKQDPGDSFLRRNSPAG